MASIQDMQANRLHVLKELESIRTNIAYSGLTNCEYQAIIHLKHFIKLMYEKTERDTVKHE